MSSHMKKLLSFAAAMALVLSACGSSDDGSDGGDNGGGGDGDEMAADGAFVDPEIDCTEGTIEYDPTAGVEGNVIKVGTVRPAAGPYAIYDRVTNGVEAYFEAVNNDGGVELADGETYTFEVVKGDDEYDPAKTPGEVQKLVEQDGIFAMVGEIGTANNLAVRDYMNTNCIPSISLATGSTEWGNAEEYRWFIGGLPSYATEAHRFMDWLKEEQPDAKTIALLYQDDDFGQAYKAMLEKDIEGTDIEIVAEESYNPGVETSTESKVSALSQSDADVFFVGIGGTPCPQSLGFIPDAWDPITYISVTCASSLAMTIAGDAADGVYSTQATLDPAGPTDQSNPKIVEFAEKAAGAGLDEGTITDGIAAPGWNMAALFVRGLENAETVTRHDLMNAMFSMDAEDVGITRDDIKVSTNGAEDPWLIESLAMVQRDTAVGEWVEVSGVVDYEGMSNEFAGM